VGCRFRNLRACIAAKDDRRDLYFSFSDSNQAGTGGALKFTQIYANFIERQKTNVAGVDNTVDNAVNA
jgi:hypothetical protein